MATFLDGEVTEEEINAKVSEMSGQLSSQLTLLENQFETLNESDLKISDELESLTNELVDYHNATYANTENALTYVNSENDTLTQVLERLVYVFKLETIVDTQVRLSSPINVKLRNGKIGGIETERVYAKGENIRTILTDILDPYINILEAKEILTPIKEQTKIHWFIKDVSENYIEVNPKHIRNIEYIGKIYFTVDARNKYSNSCSLSYVNIYTQQQLTEKTIITPVGYTVFDDVYYMYGDVNFRDNTSDATKNIILSWTSNNENGIVYDSHGDTTPTGNLLNPNNLTIQYIAGDDFDFVIDRPDIYYGTVRRSYNLSRIQLTDFTPAYIDENITKLTLTTTSTNNKIVILIEDNFSADILDQNGALIEDYFDKTLVNIPYNVYSYDVLNGESIQHNLRIRRE